MNESIKLANEGVQQNQEQQLNYSINSEIMEDQSVMLICNFPDVIYFQEGPGLRKFQYREKGIPFLNIRTLINERVDKSLCKFLDVDEVNTKYQHFLLEEGDIVCSTSGTIGKTAIIQKQDLPMMLNTSIIRFRSLNEKVMTTSYIYYFLRSNDFLLQAEKNATGTAQKNVGPSHLKEFVIPFPPLAEQQQIAAKLDELLAQVDNLKTRLDTIPKILKRFRQSVLAAAVSGKLTEDWHATKSLGVVLTIGEVASDIRYGTSKKCDYEKGNTPVIRIPNIDNGFLNLTDMKFADFDDKELKSLSLVVGDLLLIRSNGSVDLVGKTALISENDVHCLYAGYLIRIRLNQQLVVPKYVLYCLQSSQIRKIIEMQARSTSGVNNINSKELAALPFLRPSLQEQTEIVARVEQLFALADQIEQRVKDAQSRVNHLTQAILAKAFRGELTADWRAQNPDLISGENSAEALLARIKAEREMVVKHKKTGKKEKA